MYEILYAIINWKQDICNNLGLILDVYNWILAAGNCYAKAKLQSIVDRKWITAVADLSPRIYIASV